jgi:hypothetical protein
MTEQFRLKRIQDEEERTKREEALKAELLAKEQANLLATNDLLQLLSEEAKLQRSAIETVKAAKRQEARERWNQLKAQRKPVGKVRLGAIVGDCIGGYIGNNFNLPTIS